MVAIYSSIHVLCDSTIQKAIGKKNVESYNNATNIYSKHHPSTLHTYTFYILVPSPNVTLTALNQSIGHPLSLRCDVNIVRGIASSVDIVWKVNGTTLKQQDGNISENRTYVYYYYNASMNLTVDDNNTVYQCEVIVNASPPISNTDNFTLSVIGK